MNRETISQRQGFSMVVMFIIGISIIFIPGLEAGRDAWLAVFISLVFSLPFILSYSFILYLNPDKNLYEILHTILGNIAGKAIAIAYALFAFYLSAIILRNLADYISQFDMQQTPDLVPMLFITLLIIWIVKDGVETIGKWSYLFFLIIFIMIIITLILLIPEMDINRIRPVLYNGYKPFFKGVFKVLIFPFTELVIFTTVFNCFKNKINNIKALLKGAVFGGCLGTVFTIAVILVIGETAAMGEYYPSYLLMKRINLGNIIQRMEIVTVVSYIITGYMKAAISLLAVVKGITRVFKMRDYRAFVTPVCLLALIFSTVLYTEMADVVDFYLEYWPYFALLFQVVLPIIILFGCIVNKKKKDLLKT